MIFIMNLIYIIGCFHRDYDQYYQLLSDNIDDDLKRVSDDVDIDENDSN